MSWQCICNVPAWNTIPCPQWEEVLSTGAIQSGTTAIPTVVTALPDRAVWDLEKVLRLVAKMRSWGVSGEIQSTGVGALLELRLSVPVDGTELDWVLSEFLLGPVESSDEEEGVKESFRLEA